MSSNSQCTLVLATLCALVGWPGSARAAQDGSAVTLHSGTAKPVIITMRQMLQDDARINRDIAAGRRPPRWSGTIPVGRPPMLGQAADGPPVSFLPAIFSAQGPEIRVPDSPRRSDTIRALGGRWRPMAPQGIWGFPGINHQEEIDALGTNIAPPDCMGAIGPNHFLEVINGGVSVYDRAGTRISLVSLNSFFGNGAVGMAFDPRVHYDVRSGRWFATCVELGNGSENNSLFFTFSENSDPTGSWAVYRFGGEAGWFTDYETLGIDDNTVSFGMTMFPASSGSVGGKLIIMAKSSIVWPAAGISYWYTGHIGDMYSSPIPVPNYDAIGGGDTTWFAASSNSVYANVVFRGLTWSGGSPALSGLVTVATPAFGAPMDAPALGTTGTIDTLDMRLIMAMIRKGRLVTCRTVGTDLSGGAGTPTRTAVEWLEFNPGGGPALIQSGRYLDTTASDPYFCYNPSLAISGQGHMALTFSVSSSFWWPGIATCGRLDTDPLGTMQYAVWLKNGDAAWNWGSSPHRWGDYAYTSIDPNDDMSLWTINEYGYATDRWGTWIAKLTAPAPTLTNPGATVTAGQTSRTVALTGTGLYDPGAGYPNHLAGSFVNYNGGYNGFYNVSMTYVSPTSAQIHFDVHPDAQGGVRDIEVTNPDGQVAVAAQGITVTEGAGTTLTVPDQTGTVSQSVNLRATLTRTSDGALITGRLVYFWVNGMYAGSATTDGSGVATLPFGIYEGLAPAVWIEAMYYGEVGLKTAYGYGALYVNRAGTVIATIGRTGTVTETTTLRGYLKRTTDNAWLDGKTITFKIDGTAVGTAATGATGTAGRADLNWVITAGPTTRTIAVEFAGTTDYVGSTAFGTLTSLTWTTKMVGFARTARIAARTELKALLLRSDNTPLAGRSVRFSVDGTFVIARPTDATGYAKYPYYDVPDGTGSGSRPILSQWLGNDGYFASSATVTLTVLKSLPYIWVLPKTVPLGGTAGLYAYFRRLPDYQKQAGKTVTFRVDGTAVQTVVTDAVGVARYSYRTVQPVGDHTIRCEFAGDAWVEAGYGEGRLRVY